MNESVNREEIVGFVSDFIVVCRNAVDPLRYKLGLSLDFRMNENIFRRLTYAECHEKGF